MRFIIKAGLLMAIICNFATAEPLSVTTVDKVDLNRYCGTWYEIARLPNRFQKECVGNSTAAYSLMENGRIKVINRCQKADSSYIVAEGVARKQDKDGPDARLEVRFARRGSVGFPKYGGHTG